MKKNGAAKCFKIWINMGMIDVKGFFLLKSK